MRKLVLAVLALGAEPAMVLAQPYAAQPAASDTKAQVGKAKTVTNHAKKPLRKARHHAKKTISDRAKSQEKAVDQGQ
jgi:hypothetical protein